MISTMDLTKILSKGLRVDLFSPLVKNISFKLIACRLLFFQSDFALVKERLDTLTSGVPQFFS